MEIVEHGRPVFDPVKHFSLPFCLLSGVLLTLPYISWYPDRGINLRPVEAPLPQSQTHLQLFPMLLANP